MKDNARLLLRRSMFVAVLLTLASGCSGGGEDQPAVPDDGPASQTNTDARDAAAPPELRDLWSNMESKDIVAHADSHGYREAGRSETDHRKCAGGQESADCNLRITPLWGVRRLDTAAVGTNGVILARVENFGTVEETHLGIGRGATRYWMVVRKGGVLKSYFLDLAGPRPVARNEANFLVCKKPHDDGGHGGPSLADFRRCPPPDSPEGLAETPVMTDHTSPPWTTCSLGCCYADLPEG